MSLTQPKLKELLQYNQESGAFIWLSGRRAGYPAGCSVNNRGYGHVQIDGHVYLAHRLAWLYVTGDWPKHIIDHIDLNKMNNRFANLREATPMQSNANRSRCANNKSGFKGVHWSYDVRKWRASIRVKGRFISLGWFDLPEDAHGAYCAAAEKYFGSFARPT